jgi:hypothetical protein
LSENVTDEDQKERLAAGQDENLTRGIKYWLMKAEPETRIVKGKVSLFWSIALIEIVGC